MSKATLRELEWIEDSGERLGLIVPASAQPSETTFLTPGDYPQQLGFIVYPRNGEVRPHTHRRVHREIDRTCEVVLVRSGRCEVDFYREDGRLVTSRELGPGDLVALVSGGHGFRMSEDTVLLEIKQGPYAGVEDKAFL